MSKFTKKGVRLILSKEEQAIEDYINNQKYTTSDSIWTGGIYNGFKIQKAADTPNNRIRGDHHKRALDSIFTLLKWNCSKYSKSLVIRYNLFPAYVALDIKKFQKDLVERLKKVSFTKDGEFVSGNKPTGQSVYGDPSYIWVREIGTSEKNQGEHFHGVVFCKKLQGISVKQTLDNFRNVATSCIRLQLVRLLASAKPKTNNYKILKSSLDELTAMADEDDQLESPYVEVGGHFVLERSTLDKRHAKEQQADIDRLLLSGSGHNYLNIEKIKEREHNTNRAIGGILEECVYALSYLSKCVSKTSADFPNGTKLYSTSQMSFKGIKQSRKEQIEEHQKEVNRIFEKYDIGV